MQISQFFMNGDIKGAIAYMREHEEFQDILPAYIAVFENCEYRTYDVPEFPGQILLLYAHTKKMEEKYGNGSIEKPGV